MNFKKNKGLNLVELMLVLGVVSALLATAFFLYGKNRDEIEANDNAQKVALVAASAKSIFETAGATTEGLSPSVLTELKVLPSEDVMNSKWGRMQIQGGDVSTGDACTSATPTCTGVSIYYDFVPQNSCLPFVQRVLPNAITMKIDEQFVKTIASPDVDIATITTLCRAADLVKVQMVFN